MCGGGVKSKQTKIEYDGLSLINILDENEEEIKEEEEEEKEN